jgi:hypothetical protein
VNVVEENNENNSTRFEYIPITKGKKYPTKKSIMPINVALVAFVEKDAIKQQ